MRTLRQELLGSVVPGIASTFIHMHAASGGGYHSGSSSCSSSLSLSAAPRLADSCWLGMRWLGTPPSTSSPCWVGASGGSQLICVPFSPCCQTRDPRRVPQRLALLMLFDPISPATLPVTAGGCASHGRSAGWRYRLPDGGPLANTVARGSDTSLRKQAMRRCWRVGCSQNRPPTAPAWSEAAQLCGVPPTIRPPGL
jgi:hypothetical protein